MAFDPSHRTPRWLAGSGSVGGNLQTLWPALFARRHRGSAPVYERERWTTPDGQDFIDLDWQRGAGAAPQPQEDGRSRPLLVLFHGLEGSSRSHYAQAFAHWAGENGWGFVVPHFRGCSGELNLAPRSYHSGDFEEIGWVLERLRAQHSGPMVAVGVSLGGNALLRWAQEAGATASKTVAAVCAISAPLDLPACGHALGLGFNRQVYTRMFLRSMLPKALRKAAMFPKLIDASRLRRVRSLHEFDDLVTGPLHGFRDADDYWARAAAKPHLHRIRIPALVVNALNDPFVPARSLPQAHEVGAHVTLWQPGTGGHVGFAEGHWPGHLFGLPEQVMGWMSGHIRPLPAWAPD